MVIGVWLKGINVKNSDMTEVPPNEILDVPCKTVSLTRFFDPANR
jgi:hypothetical protein